MTNAQTISIERSTRVGGSWLETSSFQAVRLLPSTQGAARISTRKSHRARRFVVAAVAAAALTVGGAAAVHVAHAGAVATPSTPASVVKVDASSNPNTAANKTITALAINASTSTASTSASLPAMGAQN